MAGISKDVTWRELSLLTKMFWEKIKMHSSPNNSIEIEFSDTDLRHRERGLKMDEKLVLMAYRYQRRRSRNGENGNYERSGNRLGSAWRIMCTLKPSGKWSKLEIEDFKGFDGLDGEIRFKTPKYLSITMLRPDNYKSHGAARAKENHKYIFTRYAIAIIRNTAPYPNAFKRGLYVVEEMRELKVSASVVIKNNKGYVNGSSIAYSIVK